MGRRRALLIGIDDYANPARRLPCCVAGATEFGDSLSGRFGFKEVVSLFNRDATRDGILSAMAAFAESTEKDDLVVFYYSGHGSYPKCPEAPDGHVRGLTGVDHECGDGPRLVTQFDLFDWWSQLTAITNQVVIVLDTCYSGKTIRDGSRLRAKYWPTDALVATRPPAPQPRRFRESGPSGWLPPSDRYTLLAACRARESAYILDTIEPKRCVFTHTLCRELERIEAGASYRDLIERVRWRVQRLYSGQTPQAEGAIDREVFGGGSRPRLRYHSISQRSGDSVLVAAGALHELVPGAIWDVYDERTSIFDGSVEAIGRLRATAVHATYSEAAVVEEVAPQAVAAGARAVERESAIERERCVVRLEDGATGETETALFARLRGRIERSVRLRLGGDDEPAFGRIRVERRAGDGTLLWSVRDEADQPMRKPLVLSDSGSIEAVIRFLEARTEQRALLDLAASSVDEPISRALTFDLRVRVGDHWVAPPLQGGEPIIREGERVMFTLRHDFPHELHPQVFDLGVGGGIEQLFPRRGANDRLLPGPTLEICERETERFELEIPAHVADREDGASEVGRERIVVFATLGEVDLSGSERRIVRGERTHTIERRFRRARARRIVREEEASSSAIDPWGAAVFTFLVARTEAGCEPLGSIERLGQEHQGSMSDSRLERNSGRGAP